MKLHVPETCNKVNTCRNKASLNQFIAQFVFLVT